jgi:hypothetical protein
VLGCEKGYSATPIPTRPVRDRAMQAIGHSWGQHQLETGREWNKVELGGREAPGPGRKDRRVQSTRKNRDLEGREAEDCRTIQGLGV